MFVARFHRILEVAGTFMVLAAAISICLIAMSFEFECIVGHLCCIEMGFAMLRRLDCSKGIMRGLNQDLISLWLR